MRFLLVAFVMVCTFTLFAQQETVIKGKLLGFDKKPMVLAHAFLIKAPAPKPIAQAQAQRDGSFILKTKETGLLVAEFTGVNHMAIDVPLLIEKPSTNEMTVTLATYAFADQIKEVKVMSDLTNFVYEQAQTMNRRDDGTFAIELQTTNDKVRYQVLGAEKSGRSINGTQSDAFEYDGGGDYRSIVAAHNGKVTIVFDPKKTVRSPAEPKVAFADPRSAVAKIASIQGEMSKRSPKVSEAMNSYVKAGNDWRTFKYDWSADQASIVALLKTEKDPLVRQALLLDYVDTKNNFAAKGDPVIGAQLFKEIPPDSKLWMIPTLPLLKAAGDLCGDENLFKNYLTKFLDKNPDMTLKTTMLMNQLTTAKMMGDQKALTLYYDLAVKFFGDSPTGAMVKQRFSPVTNVGVGKPVPDFSVKSFDDNSKVFTNAALKGTFYLIDFWATWCGPCVSEMENMHKAYERFRTKNFQILSLSLDRDRSDVTTFRAEKWKMPWLHSFVTEDTALTTKFEVIGIPKPMLIDANGTIVAMDMDLRGDQLAKTLAKFLEKSK